MSDEVSPLPWTYDRNNQAVREANGFRIAMVDSISDGAEIDRNGLLMAGSPDLLKVARSVVYVAEHSGSNAAFILRGLVEDARLAIAKATEQTP